MDLSSLADCLPFVSHDVKNDRRSGRIERRTDRQIDKWKIQCGRNNSHISENHCMVPKTDKGGAVVVISVAPYSLKKLYSSKLYA